MSCTESNFPNYQIGSKEWLLGFLASDSVTSFFRIWAETMETLIVLLISIFEYPVIDQGRKINIPQVSYQRL
jgi:hypothetical protein